MFSLTSTSWIFGHLAIEGNTGKSGVVPTFEEKPESREKPKYTVRLKEQVQESQLPGDTGRSQTIKEERRLEMSCLCWFLWQWSCSWLCSCLTRMSIQQSFLQYSLVHWLTASTSSRPFKAGPMTDIIMINDLLLWGRPQIPVQVCHLLAVWPLTAYPLLISQMDTVITSLEKWLND